MTVLEQKKLVSFGYKTSDPKNLESRELMRFNEINVYRVDVKHSIRNKN